MDKKNYLNKIYYGKHIFCLGLLFSTTGIMIDRKWEKKNDREDVRNMRLV